MNKTKEEALAEFKQNHQVRYKKPMVGTLFALVAVFVLSNEIIMSTVYDMLYLTFHLNVYVMFALTVYVVACGIYIAKKL